MQIPEELQLLLLCFCEFRKIPEDFFMHPYYNFLCLYWPTSPAGDLN